jgi:hypothetical protein
MMNDIFSKLPIIEPEKTVTFENFAYGVSGSLINNPYLYSLYDFGFNFSLLLSVIGVEGIAFEDVDANGVYEIGVDRPLPNTKLQLFRDGEPDFMAETATDEHGRYEFADVPHGNSYYLSVEAPAGMGLIEKGTGEASSHFGPDSNKTETFLVEENESYRYNAGFVAKQGPGPGPGPGPAPGPGPDPGGCIKCPEEPPRDPGKPILEPDLRGNKGNSCTTIIKQDITPAAKGKSKANTQTPKTGGGSAPWLYALSGAMMIFIIVLSVREIRRNKRFRG